jgi:HEAT repeat protein
LKDSAPEVRAAAIDAIDAIRSNDDAPLLVESLHDPDASVILAAEKALADLPDASAAPVLTEIYENEKYSPEVRDQAFSTLAAICEPSSTPIFVQGLKTPHGVSCTAAQGLVCTLEKQPDPSVFQAVLDAEVHTEDLAVREDLIRALGDTKNPAALPILEKLANSHHPTLAPPAAAALGSLGDRQALPILTELLRDSNHNVRVSAALSFSKFSDFTAPPELIAALFDPDAGMAISATKAVTNSHDPKAIDAVIAKIPDPMAVYVLGKSHDARAYPALLAVLQNPANATDQRRAAASALGELGDSRAVDPLIALLNEDNFALTQSAIFALTALKDKRAIEPLQRTRARWSKGERQNAQSVIVNIDMALGTLGATTEQVTGSPQ